MFNIRKNKHISQPTPSRASHRKFSLYKSLGVIGAVLVSCMILLMVTYKAYNQVVRPVALEELPLVSNTKCEARVEPVERGGLVISNQDMMIYNSIRSPSTASSKGSVVAMEEDKLLILRDAHLERLQASKEHGIGSSTEELKTPVGKRQGAGNKPSQAERKNKAENPESNLPGEEMPDSEPVWKEEKGRASATSIFDVISSELTNSCYQMTCGRFTNKIQAEAKWRQFKQQYSSLKLSKYKSRVQSLQKAGKVYYVINIDCIESQKMAELIRMRFKDQKQECENATNKLITPLKMW